MAEKHLVDLIDANHILHHQNVADAYGHISCRHPTNSNIYIMAASLAPALVEGVKDLVEYNLFDSSPVDYNQKKNYQERFIHGEIYKRFPSVKSVVHSHSYEVVPYTMNGVPMQPTNHIGGFLGTHVPNFDILEHYQEGEKQDMLVNSVRLGAALADTFSVTGKRASNSQHICEPLYNVVLMKNHGFTALGYDIPQVVYRAVYTHVNAKIQSTAITVRNAHLELVQEDKKASENEEASEVADLRYLGEAQMAACQEMNDNSQERPWKLWVKEVRSNPLYDNNAIYTC